MFETVNKTFVENFASIIILHELSFIRSNIIIAFLFLLLSWSCKRIYTNDHAPFFKKQKIIMPFYVCFRMKSESIRIDRFQWINGGFNKALFPN